MSTWATGSAYEAYVGRWSRLVAREFLAWLDVAPGSGWVDVGCGPGALSATILEAGQPSKVVGIDASDGFLAYAREHIRDPRAEFRLGDAHELPLAAASFDAAVSALVLNFLARPNRALAEMARVTRPGGIVATYLWDYSDKMQLIRYFWTAAARLDPAAADLDEGRRFSICNPAALEKIFAETGLEEVAVRAVDVPTVFRDFDDYWAPFLGGQGPAPTYAVSLTEARRAALRDGIRASLPIADDGSIPLSARAWVARGRVRN